MTSKKPISLHKTDKYKKLSNSLQKVEQGKIPVSEYFGDLIEAGRKSSGQQFVDEQIEIHKQDLKRVKGGIFDYPTTPKPYEYKQQGFLPFANPPRFTEEH